VLALCVNFNLRRRCVKGFAMKESGRATRSLSVGGQLKKPRTPPFHPLLRCKTASLWRCARLLLSVPPTKSRNNCCHRRFCITKLSLARRRLSFFKNVKCVTPREPPNDSQNSVRLSRAVLSAWRRNKISADQSAGKEMTRGKMGLKTQMVFRQHRFYQASIL
jgi:hypothetical protein